MNEEKSFTKVEINWYPGHMAKTKRLIKEKLDLVDIVYEIIDARIPKSSKIKDIDNILKNKKRILIMTKIDLCDITKTQKWIKYYEQLGYKVISLDLINSKNINKVLEVTNEMMKDEFQKRKEKGLQKRRVRALVIGIPNVGKSTFINKLVGKKAVNVGNKPGITKSIDWIRINKDIELLDTPGILWPKLDDMEVAYNLASMTAIKEEVLPIDKVAIYILNKLNKEYNKLLEKRYGITDIDNENILNTFDIIGKKRGCILKGGTIDYEKVEKLIIRDLKEGLIGNVTFD